MVRGKPSGLDAHGDAALREITGADALFISGAGVFNDRYAKSLGAVWGLIAHCSSALGKPVIFSGQQVGPLDDTVARLITSSALKVADFVGVRDPISLEVARSLGVKLEQLGLTGDDAWDQPSASGPELTSALGGLSLPPRFIAAQVRLDGATGFSPSDAETVARLLDRAADILNLPVVFVSMFYSEEDDDRVSASIVASKMHAPNQRVTENLDAATTKALLQRASLAVGASYHFCVFSISAGTPTLGYFRSAYMIQTVRGLKRMWPDMIVGAPLDADHSSDSIDDFLDKLSRVDREGCGAPVSSGPAISPELALQSLANRLAKPGFRRTRT
jgi:polysaccharide pyruvyl transferase WcaK-like protein